jgi:hypothetical protein
LADGPRGTFGDNDGRLTMSRRIGRRPDELLAGDASMLASDAPARAGKTAMPGGPLSVQALAELQQTAGNRAATHLLVQRAKVLHVQRDDYPYGGANVTPHIHRYGTDCHLKILDGKSIRRINLVQGGKRYPQGVAEAFALARAAGNTTLVEAIKTCIRGIGPFGRPGSAQHK